MTKSPSELLVEHGFIKKEHRSKYRFDEVKKKWVPVFPDAKIDPSHADEEYAEEANYSSVSQLLPTGYPSPAKRYRLIVEQWNLSMEETYYWFLNHLRQDMAFPEIKKITDIFSASETSAFFGQSAQRLSIQEDRAASFLRGIAELVKQLFQLVRELRIIDERLEIYNSWEVKGPDGSVKRSKSADITLKGIFADFAENKGGQMQPGSIYHLAQNVGYTVLPDLFFNTHVYRKEDVDKVVDGMKNFNPNVRNVLKRKLYQFLVWKEKTHKELINRRKFQIRYLRQHWAVIKMYVSWTKPYLRHIKRLHMNEQQMDSPDLITAFETSMTEIEILAIKPKVKGYHPCILATFQYNTKPVMQYRQEYNQGPVHVGRATVTLRAYAWTPEQIEAYKRMREAEEQDLLYLVDESVKMAMDELGEDLEKYLNEEYDKVFAEEVHEKFGKKESSSVPAKTGKKRKLISAPPIWEPFGALFGGFKELALAFVPSVSFKKEKKSSDDPKSAAKAAMGAMWQAYKNYKKSHGLLSW